MKVFQVFVPNPVFYRDFDSRNPSRGDTSYQERLRSLIDEYFMSPHILLPALRDKDDFFFAYANDEKLCDLWASENRLGACNHYDVLRDQIKQFKPDVLYIMHPFIHGPEFVKTIRQYVGKVVCWHAGPHVKGDFSCFDIMLSNFPPHLNHWKSQGIRGEFFCPAVDSKMKASAKEEREYDLVFVGNLGGVHHKKRTSLVSDLVKSLGDDYKISICGGGPRWKPLFKNGRFLSRIPSLIPALPRHLTRVTQPPVFGQRLYELFGNSKLCLNVAGNTSLDYRVNMRCFEAMGSGACMLSDSGRYLEHFRPKTDFETYDCAASLIDSVHQLLKSPDRLRDLASSGFDMVHKHYSKELQWDLFKKICS